LLSLSKYKSSVETLRVFIHADVTLADLRKKIEKGEIEKGGEEKPKRILYLSFDIYDFANYLEDIWLENFAFVAIYENCNYTGQEVGMNTSAK